MKVLLVECFRGEELDFSIGVLSLATIINEKYDCDIIDLDYLFRNHQINEIDAPEGISEIVDYLLKQTPDIIGFSCMCNNYHLFIRLAEKLKETNADIKFFFGGPQATLTAQETIKQFSWIDYICLGESETTILDTLEFIYSSEKTKIPKNICYRGKDEIIMKKEMEHIKDLDSLPKLDYSLIPFFKDIKTVNIEVGRGCPFSCTYCSTKTFWKQKTRYKSNERIIMEIKYLKDYYNKKHFTFVHDLFTARRNFIISFCKQLIESKMNITWTCSSRMDTIDSELIDLMITAGCVGIFFGIETGSSRMQRIINKNLNIEKIDELLYDLRKFGMKSATFSFIYDFPDETEEDLEKTLNLMYMIKFKYHYNVILNKCTILPGTQLFDEHLKNLNYRVTHNGIAGNMNIKDYEEMITQNKNIFPYYCELETIIHNKYRNLESFFTAYSMMNSHYRGTVKFMNEYFNESIKEMFLMFNDFYEKEIIQLSDMNFIYRESLTNNGFIALNQRLYSFLWRVGNEFFEEDMKTFFKEIIQFERFLYQIEDNKYKKLQFQNDIVRFMQTDSNISSCINNKCNYYISKKHNRVKIENL